MKTYEGLLNRYALHSTQIKKKAEKIQRQRHRVKKFISTNEILIYG